MKHRVAYSFSLFSSSLTFMMPLLYFFCLFLSSFHETSITIAFSCWSKTLLCGLVFYETGASHDGHMGWRAAFSFFFFSSFYYLVRIMAIRSAHILPCTHQ